MPLATFLSICPLDLEELCLAELLEKSQDLEITGLQQINGGLIFQASLEHGCALNHRLKIPTRLLLQLTQFKCRDLPKLFQKTLKFPWREWLDLHDFQWKVSASQSRLMHTGKMEETLKDAVNKSFQQQAPKKRSEKLDPDFTPLLYARIENDVMTLSLDLSGEPLFKRGNKLFTTTAPLRESLAQACWQMIVKQLPKDVTTLELYDPMAGTGTFLLEASQAQKDNFERSFAYQFIPKTIVPPKRENSDEPLLSKIFACDLDARALRENTKNLKIEICEGDCFTHKLPKKSATRIVISNPPYGERIKKEFKVSELIQLYKENIEADYVGLLGPAAWDIEGVVKKENILSKKKFKNGALAVCFWVLKF